MPVAKDVRAEVDALLRRRAPSTPPLAPMASGREFPFEAPFVPEVPIGAQPGALPAPAPAPPVQDAAVRRWDSGPVAAVTIGGLLAAWFAANALTQGPPSWDSLWGLLPVAVPL